MSTVSLCSFSSTPLSSAMDYSALRLDGRYLHTTPVALASALKSGTLCPPSEEDVYELLLDWTYYDLPARKEHFPLLFEAVRLAYVPRCYVDRIIGEEPLVKENPVTRGAVTQCLRMGAQVSKNKSVTRATRDDAVGKVMGGAARDHHQEISILVCGGRGTETLTEIYDPATNSWRQLEESVGRSNAAAFTLPNGVCVVGGEDRLRGVVSKTFSFSTTLEVETPGQCRSGARCASLEGRTYLVGGMTPDEGYVATVERFTIETNRWVPVKSMSRPRFSFGCATLAGFIYACGGFDGERDLSECEFFMPECNEWTEIAPLNRRRSGCATVAADGKLFTLGGWDGTQVLSSCEVYDPRGNRWQSIAPMNRSRHGLVAVSVGNVIFAIGGWNGEKKLSSIECYHTRSDHWELLRPMSKGRWLPTAITIPSSLNL
eukprot:sb/3464892/